MPLHPIRFSSPAEVYKFLNKLRARRLLTFNDGDNHIREANLVLVFGPIIPAITIPRAINKRSKIRKQLKQLQHSSDTETAALILEFRLNQASKLFPLFIQPNLDLIQDMQDRLEKLYPAPQNLVPFPSQTSALRQHALLPPASNPNSAVDAGTALELQPLFKTNYKG